MIVDLDFRNSVDEGAAVLVSELQKEIKAQGHVLTGEFLNSIETEISYERGSITITLLWSEYGNYLERGVKKNRIPFRLGSGKKSSKFIDSLIAYFEKRGLSGKEAKGAAFATAKKQKEEGMPTRNSYKFSSNGRRTGMIERVVEDKGARIVALLQEGIAEKLQVSLTQNVTGIFKQVRA